MGRKNREEHQCPLVNFSSLLKQSPRSRLLTISTRVSLCKGGGFAGDGNNSRFGGERVVEGGDGEEKLGPLKVLPREPQRCSTSFSS